MAGRKFTIPANLVLRDGEEVEEKETTFWIK